MTTLTQQRGWSVLASTHEQRLADALAGALRRRRVATINGTSTDLCAPLATNVMSQDIGDTRTCESRFGCRSFRPWSGGAFGCACGLVVAGGVEDQFAEEFTGGRRNPVQLAP